MALKWLVLGVQSGDSLVFHFSGHGSRERDKNMDEIDGYDETLCPVDYETQGKIIDDEVNDTIVRPIPRGAKLHAIIDACYSGTVLDLPYLCRMNRYDTCFLVMILDLLIILKTEVHSCVGAGKESTHGNFKHIHQVFIKAPVVG